MTSVLPNDLVKDSGYQSSTSPMTSVLSNDLVKDSGYQSSPSPMTSVLSNDLVKDSGYQSSTSPMTSVLSNDLVKDSGYQSSTSPMTSILSNDLVKDSGYQSSSSPMTSVLTKDNIENTKYCPDGTEKRIPDLSSAEHESKEQVETSYMKLIYQTVKQVSGGLSETLFGNPNKAEDKICAVTVQPEIIIVQQNKDEKNGDKAQFNETSSAVTGDETASKSFEHKRKLNLHLRRTEKVASHATSMRKNSIDFAHGRELYDSDISELRDDLERVLDSIDPTCRNSREAQNSESEMPFKENDKDDNEMEVDETDDMGDIEEDAVKNNAGITRGNDITMVSNNLNNTGDDTNNERNSKENNSVTSALEHNFPV
uniref:Uncharacterized protein n=1 Tax=Cacopsylla melanoneura TaxID=428564 RepID=A0A8D8YKW2_9HEMI